MPIKVACSCGQKFSARDAMAGKRVKCPKCNEPLTIPKPRSSRKEDDARLAQSGGIADLLDEVGVQGARTGPICPECGTDMLPTAVICIECGFNVAMGRKMYTENTSGYDDMSGKTNAEKLLAKAERELDATPMGAENQDFGDGGDAWLIALGAIIVAATMTIVTLLMFYVMDQLDQQYTATLSLLASVLISIVGFWWIVIRGFLEHWGHGLALLFSPALAGLLGLLLGLFCLLFSAPGVGVFIGSLIGMAYFFYYASTRSMWIAEIMYIGGNVMANIMILVIAASADSF